MTNIMGKSARRRMMLGSIFLSSVAGASVPIAAAAAETKAIAFNIPAQGLGSALGAFARQSRQQLLYSPQLVAGRASAGLKGRYSASAGLERLLAGSSLGFRTASSGAFVLFDTAAASAAAAQPELAAAHVDDGAGQGGDDTDSDIVVTASRREQSLQEVPMSVSALSQQEIDRRGIRSLLDLSRAVPGMVVSEQGPGQNRIFLRGIANPNSLTALVGLYVDEIPVTSSSLGQPDLQLLDLERVEVLRGPQGTLYGQGSAGGTIRFITRRPDLDSFSGETTLTAYATEHGDPSARLTGIANIPIVEGVLGVRMSGTFAELGGWLDQPAAGREDINDQSLRNFRIKALWKPLDGLEIEGSFIIHRNKGDGIPMGADKDYNISFPNGDPLARERFTDEYEIYNLTATYDLGDVELMSSTSYFSSDTLNAGGSTRVPGLETFNTDRFDNHAFSQEIRLSASNPDGLSWVVGGFHTNEEVNRLLMLNLYSGGVFLGEVVLPSTNKSKTWSAFGDVSYAVTPRLDIGAGIRYFHDRRKDVGETLTLSAPFSSVNPRFYMSYDLADDIKLYANVAKGFRSGGFLGDFEQSTFDPEKVWSYEVGTKGSSGAFRWELTGFYSEYKGYQAFVLFDQVFGGLTNAGDAEIIGLDWLLAVDPIDNLTLQVSGNVTDTKLVTIEPGTTSNNVGDRLDFIPDYVVSASAEYRFDWSASKPGFVRVDYTQIGKATFTDRSLPVIAFPSDTISLLNGRIGLASGRWEFELFGENLLGERGLHDPLSAIGLGGARPRPRAFGARLGARF